MKIIEKLKAKTNDIYNQEPVTIAFLGGSFTQGCFECYVDEGKIATVCEYKNSFSTRMREILNILYPNVQINIINSGLSGDYAENGKNRLERDILKYHPDLCVVAYLLNDIVLGEDGVERYVKSLQEIIDKLKEKDIEIIMFLYCTTCYKTSSQLKEQVFIKTAELLVKMQNEGVLNKYMCAAKELCERNNVKMVDLASVWDRLEKNGVDTTELLTNKLNHPFREYHYYVAIKLIEAMFEL